MAGNFDAAAVAVGGDNLEESAGEAPAGGETDGTLGAMLLPMLLVGGADSMTGFLAVDCGAAAVATAAGGVADCLAGAGVAGCLTVVCRAAKAALSPGDIAANAAALASADESWGAGWCGRIGLTSFGLLALGGLATTVRRCDAKSTAC